MSLFNKIFCLQCNNSLCLYEEALYLKWKERHLRDYFETLMNLLQFMTRVTNAENLRQYEYKYSVVLEQMLSFLASVSWLGK